MTGQREQRHQGNDDVIKKDWFEIFDGDCTGARCAEVRFEFVSADVQNLRYRYRDQQGRISKGVLGPRNEDYIFSWLFSVWLRLLFPPFSGSNHSCGKDCECFYGPETSDSRDYRHVYAQDFSAGRRIEIEGRFTVRVVMRTGVCIPKQGAIFGRLGDTAKTNPFAAAATLTGDPPIEDG